MLHRERKFSFFLNYFSEIKMFEVAAGWIHNLHADFKF